jgi:hypothetical protein
MGEIKIPAKAFARAGFLMAAGFRVGAEPCVPFWGILKGVGYRTTASPP